MDKIKDYVEPENKCTTCGTMLEIDSPENFRQHIFLGTLVCAKCAEFYGDGDFSKHPDAVDEEGDDNYCRWCGDGGSLLVCCKEGCHYSYCEKCLQYNMGRVKYDEITESDDWNCFKCDPKQIAPLVDYCDKIMKKIKPGKLANAGTPKRQLEKEPEKFKNEASENNSDRNGNVESEESGKGDEPVVKKRAFARKSTTRQSTSPKLQIVTSLNSIAKVTKNIFQDTEEDSLNKDSDDNNVENDGINNKVDSDIDIDVDEKNMGKYLSILDNNYKKMIKEMKMKTGDYSEIDVVKVKLCDFFSQTIRELNGASK